MKYPTLALLAVLGLGLTFGCSSKEADTTNTAKKEPAPAAPKLDPAMVKKGKQLFTTKGCAACHGDKGTGDGISAATLDPKPRNYTDKSWQASVTDAHIKKVIREGGDANGLSPMMAPYDAMFTEEGDLDAVVAFIRSLGQ